MLNVDVFRSNTCDSVLPIALDTGRLPMYWTWNFWTCCRTASRNSTETQRKGDGISREPIREQRGDVREQVSHLVWADLQVRCSPSSESEMASSATSPTSSMDTEKFYVFVFSGMYIFCHKGSLNQNNLTKDVIVWYFEVAWDYGSTTTTTKVYTAN